MGDIGPIGSANIGAASAIFDPGGRVLLVKHTYGRFNWEIPGGIALPAEPPAEAAARELREETGLDLPQGLFSGVYYEPHHSLGGPAIHFVFRHVHQEALQPVAMPPEISEVGWFELESLPVPMSNFTEARIRDAVGEGAVYRVISGRTWRT